MLSPSMRPGARAAFRILGLAAIGSLGLLAPAISTHAQTFPLYETDEEGNTLYRFTSGGVGTPFITGLDSPQSVAVDSSGNIYVADHFSTNIYKITPGGTKTTFATGLVGPSGLAFNSAGDLFESDYVGGAIYEFTPGGVKSTFTTNVVNPSPMVFNTAGDLLVGDGNEIYSFNTSANRTIFATVPGAVTAEVSGLAFNSSGDLFVSDTQNMQIDDYTNGGGEHTFTTAVSEPTNLAFNSTGLLYEANGGNGDIYTFTSGAVRNTFASGQTGPFGLAFVPPAPQNPVGTPEPGSIALVTGLGLTVVWAKLRKKLGIG